MNWIKYSLCIIAYSVFVMVVSDWIYRIPADKILTAEWWRGIWQVVAGMWFTNICVALKRKLKL